MARRQVSIYINGKEIEGTLKGIYKAKRQVTSELNRMVIGSEEYEEKVRELQDLTGVIRDHQNRLKGTESIYDKLKAGIGGFIGAAAGAFAVGEIVRYGAELFRLSASMETLERKAQTVLGETLPQVTRAAEENAAAIGLTETGYINTTAAIADLLVPMGFARQEAADMSLQLTDLAGVLSEWTGGQKSAEEAAGALRKALLGEREELESLGIKILESDVQNRLREKGLDKLTGKYREQAAAVATLELILEKSVDAQTAFANNSDTLVRKQAELQAKLMTIKETLGALLIPVFHRLVSVAESFIGVVDDLIGQPIEEKLRREQAELNLLITKITQTNTSQERRNALIGELQAKYPDFLGSLEAESVTNQQLAERLKEVNDQYIFRIALAIEEERVQRAAQKVGQAQNALAAKNDATQRRLLDLIQKYNLEVDLTNKSFEEQKQIVIDALREVAKSGRSVGLDLASIAKDGGQIYQNNVKSAEEELTLLQEQLETRRKLLIEQFGGDPLQQDIPQSSNPTEPDGDGNALAEQAQLAKLAEERRKAAEKVAQEVRKQQERLIDIVKEYQEQERLARLDDDERRLEEIRLKYQKEIDLSLELERKGAREVTEQRLELERLRDQALDELRILLAQQRLEEDLQRQEEELQVRIERDRMMAEQAAAAEAEIGEFINEALYETQRVRTQQEYDKALAELENYYQQVLSLAHQYGVDTLDLEIAFQKEKKEIRDNFQRESIDEAFDAQKKEADAMARAYGALANVVGQTLEFIGDESTKYTVLGKGLALIQIGLKTAEGLAAATAAGAGLPFPANLPAIASGVATVLSNMAAARRALEATPETDQRYSGGWYDVRGKDDGRTYHAQYLGSAGTGMLPAHPVLLASERGQEYLVSHPDLQNPVILDYVRAIENIRRFGNPSVPQFAEGGFTQAEASGGAVANSTAPPASMPIPSEFVSIMSEIRGLLQSLNSGIYAIIDDDTLVDLARRQRELNRASGGVL